jgi:hypothetical protein
MHNVIEFPGKVFRHWGANAQTLTTYLICLGATTREAEDIVRRLRVEWEISRLPLTTRPGHQITRPRSDENYIDDTGIKYHTRGVPSYAIAGYANTLFELARLEYERIR